MTSLHESSTQTDVEAGASYAYILCTVCGKTRRYQNRKWACKKLHSTSGWRAIQTGRDEAARLQRVEGSEARKIAAKYVKQLSCDAARLVVLIKRISGWKRCILCGASVAVVQGSSQRPHILASKTVLIMRFKSNQIHLRKVK